MITPKKNHVFQESKDTRFAHMYARVAEPVQFREIFLVPLRNDLPLLPMWRAADRDRRVEREPDLTAASVALLKIRAVGLTRDLQILRVPQGL
jgi:hypothetical protein